LEAYAESLLVHSNPPPQAGDPKKSEFCPKSEIRMTKPEENPNERNLRCLECCGKRRDAAVCSRTQSGVALRLPPHSIGLALSGSKPVGGDQQRACACAGSRHHRLAHTKRQEFEQRYLNELLARVEKTAGVIDEARASLKTTAGAIVK